MLRTLRPLVLLTSAACLAAPSVASAASKKKVIYPTIKSISPKKVNIGEKLTIIGDGFRAGQGKTTIVFKRPGRPVVFVKADSATTKRLVLIVPDKLNAFLTQANGAGVPTVFQLRVLTTRFGKAFTKKSLSPEVGPAVSTPAGGGDGSSAVPGVTPGAPATLTPYEQCEINVKSDPNGDADVDGLTNGREVQLLTDPCLNDTDKDGITDGYEYYSALDLNGKALPYPGKRPWPNPLDSSDANWDFDGDGLQVWQEFQLWKTVDGKYPLSQYSDGTQNTGGSMPTVGDAARIALDLDHDGNLTDNERDADNDGLSNIVEYTFRGTIAWWTDAYTDEPPYTAATFYELNPIDQDSDGDGVVDGADDQDHDGWTNAQEMEVGRSDVGLRLQPYNPCLPDPYSLTCGRYHPFQNSWPPWDPKTPANAMLPFTWPLTADPVPGHGWNGYGGPQGP